MPANIFECVKKRNKFLLEESALRTLFLKYKIYRLFFFDTKTEI